jgi:MFS family permease
MHKPSWMNREVLLISLSAFFADLGYQAVQAIFPIYLVITLSSNALYFGLANAIAFGGGALLAYVAGLLAGRYSRKWLAVLGSAFMLLLPLIGLTANSLIAILLFACGWWARNFRIPPRRAMLTDSSRKENLGRVFGFLHALDIGGGMLSVAVLLVLLHAGFGQGSLLLLTAVPIVVSTFLLLIIRDARRKARDGGKAARKSPEFMVKKGTFNGIMVATALYGFSYYSLGFPILTIASGSNALLGIGSYGVYLGVSALAGYYIGSRKGISKVKVLGYLGYVLSGIGTALLALGYALGSSVSILYLGVALMGFGLGVVETMEPTIVSLVRSAVKLDTGMGILQGSRSFGLFFANLIMGVLYIMSPSLSYIYAAVVSVAAGAIVLRAGRDFKG